MVNILPTHCLQLRNWAKLLPSAANRRDAIARRERVNGQFKKTKLSGGAPSISLEHFPDGMGMEPFSPLDDESAMFDDAIFFKLEHANGEGLGDY